MEKFTALIIEDDIDLVTIFGQAIQAAGYQVEKIQNGNEALKRMDGEPPDLIVLDMHLPGVDGVHLHQRIKNDPRYAQTRVIICTADAILAETIREDTDLVLLKPISYVQLRDLGKRLLPRS